MANFLVKFSTFYIPFDWILPVLEAARLLLAYGVGVSLALAIFNALPMHFVDGGILISCLLATKPSNWMIRSIKSGIFGIFLTFLMASIVRMNPYLMQTE
jgi:Zn-dependent protease